MNFGQPNTHNLNAPSVNEQNSITPTPELIGEYKLNAEDYISQQK